MEAFNDLIKEFATLKNKFEVRRKKFLLYMIVIVLLNIVIYLNI